MSNKNPTKTKIKTINQKTKQNKTNKKTKQNGKKNKQTRTVLAKGKQLLFLIRHCCKYAITFMILVI